MTEKIYIGAQDLLLDSFRLGLEIYRSGFRPDFIVGVWRGGTPVGIAVQEILDRCGVGTDHISIRTASYRGIGRREKEVKVYGLDYLLDNINHEDSLLIVDDVFDTGLSIQAIVASLSRKARRNTPHDIRIATPWYKPINNMTDTAPDYFVHETDLWLVFPHELDGLTDQEMLQSKPGLEALFQEIGIDPYAG